MEVRGNALAYTGGTTGRPLPHAGDTTRRGTHTPPAPKKAGLDWDALTPTCKGCGEKSSQLGPGELCPTCRGTTETKVFGKQKTVGDTAYGQYSEADVERRYVDDTRLGRDLAELEETNPAVAAAADSLALVLDQITHPEDHAQPGRPCGCSAKGRHRLTCPTKTPQAAEEAPSTPREVEPQPITIAASTAPAPRPAAAPTPDQELQAQIAHATRVLSDTFSLTNPAAQLLRRNALSALEALHLFNQMYPENPRGRARSRQPLSSVGAGSEREVGAASPAGQTTECTSGPLGEQPEGGASGEAARPPVRPRRVMGDWTGQRKTRAAAAPSARNIDVAEARRLYVDEKLTAPQIAERLGSTPAGIRRALRANGVEMRDDRKGHSGTKPRQYPPEMVDAVRHLYLDELLTIDAVAERLATTHKIVATIMRRHDIPRRPDAFHPSSPRRDNSVALKARMVELGVTSRQVKEWAITEGLIEDLRVGLPSAVLVNAYVAAHEEAQAS